MASIILKIGDAVNPHDLRRLCTSITKNLKQQNIPVIMAYTDDDRLIRQNEPQPSQNDTPPGATDKPLDNPGN